jgi:hypothetical protein
MPDTTNHKKVRLLISLGALWVLLLGWQVWNWREPVHVPLKNATGPAHESRTPPPSNGLRVRLDLLAASSAARETDLATPRNIFSSGAAAASLDAKSGPQEMPPEPRMPTPEEERQLAAAAELNQYRYLGYFRFGDRKVSPARNSAVLMKQDEIHVVHAGDTIENQVLVQAITADGVTLQHLSSRLVQTVPAVGEPLAGQPSN